MNATFNGLKIGFKNSIFNFQFPIFYLYVIWPKFHYHTAVTPRCIPMTRTHAIDHDLFGTSSSRHNYTTRTHAEAIDTSAPNLSNKTVFSSWQILTPTFTSMILYLINAMGRMLQTNTYSNTFCLNLHSVIIQPRIDIASRMACGQNNWPHKFFSCVSLNSHHFIAVDDDGIHTSLEMHLTSTTNNGITHILNNTRQLIGTNVRMRIH